MGYYIQYKNGDLEYREKRPKGRMFIEESVEHPEEQTTVHTMTLHDARGTPIRTNIMHCYCGFDRGPKHTNCLKTMFGKGGVV